MSAGPASLTFMPKNASVQLPFEVAVVIPTVLRESLLRAVRSVFAQRLDGRVQILIGVDHCDGTSSVLNRLAAECPDQCAITVLNLGYSTSKRHGGMHSAGDGGALRTILSFAANSRFVAYLDDDNWWGEEHLSGLLAAIQGRQWSFSLRWFVDGETLMPLAIDVWESVGPNAGVFAKKFGGFVDPSSLMIDKFACEDTLSRWCHPLATDPKGMSSDRAFFEAIRHRPYGASNQATAFYVMNPSDVNHSFRLHAMGRSVENR